jgi:phage recombination protein Bet
VNALTKIENTALATMDEGELMSVLQSSLYPGASVASIKLVLGYCKASGLDPMQKPCHIVPMWDSKSSSMRDVVMPGIGLYRTQAARSGCAGVSEPEFGPDIESNMSGVAITYPKWARVTVKRRLASGEIAEFTAKELWMENYAVRGGKEKSIAPNAMWTKRPYGQLAKCAEAQALRKAFPEIGSAPTADEMEGKPLEADLEVPVRVVEEQPKTLPPYPEEKFATNLPAWLKSIEQGKAKPEQIIAKLRTIGTLTQAQVDAITLPKSVVTFAQVADAMFNANDAT